MKTKVSTEGFSTGDDPKSYPEWYASDNGFSTVGKMNMAHEPIVDLATAFLSGKKGNVLDIGCGNGALLLKILQRNPGIVPYGVDVMPERVRHADELMPQFAANFKARNMFADPGALWGDKTFSLAIVMPGRFLEAGPERADALRAFLERNCSGLLLYAYGVWRERFGSFPRLAEEAGFSLFTVEPSARAGLARIGMADQKGGLKKSGKK